MEQSQQPAAVAEPVTTDPETSPPESEPASPDTSKSSKTMMMPHSAIAEIRTKERERGKKLAWEELNDKAKTLGFDSYDAMENAALKSQKKPVETRPVHDDSDETDATPEPVTPAPTSSATTREEKRLAKEHADLIEKHKEANRRIAAEEKKRKAAERDRDHERIRATLERAAYTAGIKDTDYAVTLLKRATATKSQDELASFDENKFFEGLRQTHAYLFGATPQPINTAPAGNEEPKAAVTPGQVTQNKSGNGPIDARTLSPQDYQELLRSRKITKTNLFTGR